MTRDPRRWWALAGLALAVLAAGLDGTILSVALPTLARDLGATESELQWFVSGYLLVLAAAMLPAGLLGDRFGRRRILLGSLVLFGLGSLACALSADPGRFIAARVVLGLASAGLIVMVLSAMTVLFDDQERPRAVGIWAATNFLAMPIGPILGGWLLAHYWWGWVFLMNLPVVLVGLVATMVLVPESRAPRAPGFDLGGVALSSAGLAVVTYGFVEAGPRGWTDPVTLGALAGGVLLVLGFLVWEAELGRRPGGEPLVDLRLFRSRLFTWGIVLAGIGVMAMIAVLFTMPQYFQAVLGVDAMGSGVRLIPMVGGLLVGAVPSGQVARRIGPRLTTAAGFAILAIALVGGSGTGAASDTWRTAAWMAASGLGMGMALATAASGALAELGAQEAGVGSGVMQAVQKLGGPFGSAILGSVLAGGYTANLVVTGLPPAAAAAARGSVFAGLAIASRLHSPALAASATNAFIVGLDRSLLVGAGIALGGMVLALLFMPGRPVVAPSEANVPAIVAGQ